MSSTPSYSCIQNWGSNGTGNISDDPLFVNAGNGNYQISSSSPCINAGNPSHLYDPNEMDINGRPRIVGGRVDMGAYEFSTDEPFILMPAGSLSFTALEARENPPAQIRTFNNLGYRI